MYPHITRSRSGPRSGPDGILGIVIDDISKFAPLPSLNEWLNMTQNQRNITLVFLENKVKLGCGWKI